MNTEVMNSEIISLVLALTIRGTVVLALVWLLDRAFRARMSARSRRAWWILVPVSFLLPAGFPILPPLVKTVAPVPAVAMGAELDVFGDVTFSGAADSIAGRAQGISIVDVLAVVWLAGALVYLLVVGVRTARASRHWSCVRLSTDPVLAGLLEECKAAAGVTARIGIVVSDNVPAPALFGWLRPRIMLPASLVAAGREARREQLRGILLHELAHLRARDIPLHWLHTLACAAHWFNPFAHLGARAWMRFREEAADECAIAWLGRREAGGATEYGEAFVEALKHSRTFSLPLGALAVGESNKNLKQRMLMILNHAQKTPRVALALVLTIGLAVAAALLPMRAADSQPAGAETAPAKPKAASTNPDDVFLREGIALHEQGRDAEARAAFERAIVINPRNAPSLNNLGNYEFLAGNYAKAKEYYQRAVDADPEFAEAWYDLGNAVVALGGTDAWSKAEQHYRHALKLAPDFTLAQDNLGRLLRAMNRPEEAAVYLKKINEGKNSRQVEAGGVGSTKAGSSTEVAASSLTTSPSATATFVSGTFTGTGIWSDVPASPFESGTGRLVENVGLLLTGSSGRFVMGKLDSDPLGNPNPNVGTITGSSTAPKQNYIIVGGTITTSSDIAQLFDLGQVFDLKDLDQKPQITGIQAAPVYPPEMKRQGISGEVVVFFIVDANGDVRNANIAKSSNREFEASAIEAVQKWKFRPGRKDGKAVATRLQIPIAFNLSDED